MERLGIVIQSWHVGCYHGTLGCSAVSLPPSISSLCCVTSYVVFLARGSQTFPHHGPPNSISVWAGTLQITRKCYKMCKEKSTFRRFLFLNLYSLVNIGDISLE